MSNKQVKFDNNHFKNDYSETADATPETPDYEGQFKLTGMHWLMD